MNVNLEDLALELKEEFIKHKKKFSSSYFLPARAAQSSFLKAAQLVIDHNALPEQFIAAQFYDHKDGDNMLPQFLSTSLAVKRYEEYKKLFEHTDITYEMIFYENEARLNAQKRLGFSETDILLSMSFNFATWFRLCYPKTPIKKLMDNNIIREKALREFNDTLKAFLISMKLDYKRITLWFNPNR